MFDTHQYLTGQAIEIQGRWLNLMRTEYRVFLIR